MTMSELTHPTVHKLNSIKKGQSQQIIIIKIGGSVLGELPKQFYQEIIFLLQKGWFPVIVHGGGPSITNTLNRLGIETSFINGLRVTDKATLEVVQMVLNGKENKEIVRSLLQAGGRAIGLSGIDNQMILAEQINAELGFVGKIKKLTLPILAYLQSKKIIPVISPLGIDEQGQVYNINADTVAQALAVELQASKMFMISDIPGIYYSQDGKKAVLPSLTKEDIAYLKEQNQFTGGMIPKIEAALECLEQGIDEIYILDGREEGVLKKVFNQQLVGTRILKSGVI